MTSHLLNVVSQQVTILNNLYSDSGQSKAVNEQALLDILNNKKLLRKYGYRLHKQLSGKQTANCLLDKIELTIDVTEAEQTSIFTTLKRFSASVSDSYELRNRTATRQQRYLSKYAKRLSVIFRSGVKVVLLYEPIMIARRIKVSFNPTKLSEEQLIQFFTLLKTALGKSRYQEVVSSAFLNVIERAIDLYRIPKLFVHVLCDSRASVTFRRRDDGNGIWCEFERYGSRNSNPFKSYDIPARVCRIKNQDCSYNQLKDIHGTVRLERVFNGHSQSNEKRKTLSLQSIGTISEAFRGIRVMKPTFFVELNDSEKLEVLRNGLHAVFKTLEPEKKKAVLRHECITDKGKIESQFRKLLTSLASTLIGL
ncbi:hypothetical protein [Alteromonas australica]|uniref:hypothetical protein n=1 Tax=Alteromonas australica TaxID=589873 RepID=UPI000C95C4F9|nr:hypothetical protein [Alteromonas australica]MAD44313.1 hypothetical protein [Oceanospirillaceae bacterium]|tara:strand:+ start:12484 stop:13581 length:1098 start_codon:yes stop_codon:yes gene_type:complete